MYYYTAFSLNIASEIELPGVLTLENPADAIDVKISVGQVPEQLPGDQVDQFPFLTRIKGHAIYNYDELGKIYVKEGKEIIVAPTPETDWDFLTGHVRSHGMAVIMHQRNTLTLHASAIIHEGQAILFMGKSTAGKSTTACSFISKGYGYFSDDICALGFDPEMQKIIITPSYPEIRMWQDAIELVDDSMQKVKAVRKDLDKYYVKPDAPFINKSAPISHIYLLNPDNNAGFNIQEIDNFGKLSALNQFQFAMRSALNEIETKHQFQIISQLLSQAKFKQINRSVNLSKADFEQMIEAIAADFS